jgi:hypothetical protein
MAVEAWVGALPVRSRRCNPCFEGSIAKGVGTHLCQRKRWKSVRLRRGSGVRLPRSARRRAPALGRGDRLRAGVANRRTLLPKRGAIAPGP